MVERKNSFGEYLFANWVPEDVRRQIREFWGCGSRTYEDWLSNSASAVDHDNLPLYGSRVTFIQYDSRVSTFVGYSLYKHIVGRYVHAWNNMGRLIDDDGKVHYVSGCDKWMPVVKKK